MPRPRLGAEALSNAQRQKRKRYRRASESLTVRQLLVEAVAELRRRVVHRCVVRPLHHPLGDVVTSCELCGAVDEHTPQCLIYRAERALEQLEA